MTRQELSRHPLGRVWLHVWDWLVIGSVEVIGVLIVAAVVAGITVSYWQ